MTVKAKYIRVSTLDQNTARQEQVSDEVKLYTDKLSGGIPFADRKAGRKLLQDVKDCTVSHLIVHSIDRMGRDAMDIQCTIDFILGQGCQIEVESMGIQGLLPDGTRNTLFKMITDLLANVSQMERDNIKERQREGIAIAQLRAKYKGRVKGSTETRDQFLMKHSDISTLLKSKQKHSIREIASITKKSTYTVQKVKKMITIP